MVDSKSIIGGSVTALFLIFMKIYNDIIFLKNQIKKSWSNIDVLLKQRSDEIPNLEAVVKGYMKHEKGVFERVTQIRTDIFKTRNLKKKGKLSTELTGYLKTILITAESYPQLKANKNFLELQKRITQIEDHIADRREFYNDSVNLYNTKIQSFPNNLLAKLLKFKEEKLFQ